MPLYELFALVRPQLLKGHLAEIIKTSGSTVLQQGGVITNIKYYGERPLAYSIYKPSGKYDKAAMWQLDFMAAPSALKEVEHHLKVDEHVLRHLFVKRRHLPPMPSTYRLERLIERRLRQLEGDLNQASAAQAAHA